MFAMTETFFPFLVKRSRICQATSGQLNLFCVHTVLMTRHWHLSVLLKYHCIQLIIKIILPKI